MSSVLYNKIQADFLEAFKSRKDPLKVSVLRLVNSELKNRKIDKGEELTDEDVLAVLKKAAKERNDSIDAYTKAGRKDLVDQEQEELTLLNTYLPAQLSDEEITAIIDTTISSHPEIDLSDKGRAFGMLMKATMAEIAKTGKSADGNRISILLKTKLQ